MTADVKQEEEDKLAAEWAAMADGSGDAAEGADGEPVQARVLNQNEIDSLLGVDDTESGSRDNSGIRAIIDSALVSYERLPMLEVVFDRLVAVVLSDLSGAFDPLSPVTFRFERLETNPRFATIGRPANAAVLARLRVDMEDRGGRLEVLLPYATLEPVREILLQGFLGEKFGRDSIWEAHLAGELWHTNISVEAVLDKFETSLQEVVNWKVGPRLMLTAHTQSDVGLAFGDLPLVTGK